MAEYALRTYRLYGEFPDQYVLYVGEAEMRMPSELAGPRFACRYQIFDIRSIDEESLLNSPFAGDNILAILTNNRDRRQTIRRILAANRYTGNRPARRRFPEANDPGWVAQAGRYHSRRR